MSNQKLKFEDFQGEELSKNHLKAVKGGGENDTDEQSPDVIPVDPGKGGGGGAL
ncbi:rSAM-modified peptide [Flavobacterium plurextorum]|uniref:rSAM-modified peptide n=1 Tax=Flavobacterium TaxID=237 RepID=UPI00214D5DBB|nr:MULTISPECIES: rSAM-modified peptide [Flavobacterium]UUW10373.1 rSAM-modified peptide [Flavobacterium plurextorum]